MVLDYNLFEPGKPLKNGTFIISEQIPGYVSNSGLWSVTTLSADAASAPTCR